MRPRGSSCRRSVPSETGSVPRAECRSPRRRCAKTSLSLFMCDPCRRRPTTRPGTRWPRCCRPRSTAPLSSRVAGGPRTRRGSLAQGFERGGGLGGDQRGRGGRDRYGQSAHQSGGAASASTLKPGPAPLASGVSLPTIPVGVACLPHDGASVMAATRNWRRSSASSPRLSRPAGAAARRRGGIGKTTVWGAGVEAARREGLTVLAYRGVGSEVKLGYASLTDLLSEVDGDRSPSPGSAAAGAPGGAPARRAGGWLTTRFARSRPGSSHSSSASARRTPSSSVSTSSSGSTTRRPRPWVSASVACAAGLVCSRRGAHQSHRPATPSAFARRIACGRSGWSH